MKKLILVLALFVAVSQLSAQKKKKLQEELNEIEETKKETFALKEKVMKFFILDLMENNYIPQYLWDLHFIKN